MIATERRFSVPQSYKRIAATEVMARAAPATTLFDDPNSKPPAPPFLLTGLVGVGVALVAFEGLTEVVAGAAEVVTGTEAEVVAGGAVVA